jgi:hypothetical protein
LNVSWIAYNRRSTECGDVEVALEIMPFRWLGELKASAIPSSFTFSVNVTARLSRAFKLNKSIAMPGIAID